MPSIIIDQRVIEVTAGETILQAARRVGIEIPTLCHLEGFESGASCMVCAVKLRHSGQFIPACGSRVVDGMEIDHDTDDVRDARRMALELLFSDHLGDCLSPCERICPLQLGIPAVLKHMRAGEPGLAAASARRDLPLAGILCRICSRPCENGCRRGIHDQAVAIADLVNHAIDTERDAGPPRVPVAAATRREKIAIVGAGFAGMSAAWFLQRAGFGCTVIDRNPDAVRAISERYPNLSTSLIAAEIDLLRRAGVAFHFSRDVDAAELDHLMDAYDAVLLATGPSTADQAAGMGLEWVAGKPVVDKESMQSSRHGVFLAGRAVRAHGQAVTSAADGKAVAHCIQQYLTKSSIKRLPKPFSVFIGKLLDGEMDHFLQSAGHVGRLDVMDVAAAIEESHRCVHCNCAKADVCKLRQLAIDYGVDPHRFNRGSRTEFQRDVGHPLVCFEAGKCIRCGNCIKVAGDFSEVLGLTFLGRGFDVHLGVPFHHGMQAGLLDAARAAVAACPTGALTLREGAMNHQSSE